MHIGHFSCNYVDSWCWPVRFELTIECQSSSPGEPRRLASDAQFQVAPKGQRSKAFNFHVEPMQQAAEHCCERSPHE